MSDHRLPNSLVVANAKGGVGKTTITAQLAISAAAAGRDVVAVDLDPQGNLTAELGVDPESGDAGFSLVTMALGSAGAPTLVETARPRLRCLPGGAGTAEFVRAARLEGGEDGMAVVLGEALRPLVHDGALVLIDTHGAAATPLAGVALGMARWALVPTRLDRDSYAGVAQILDQLGPGTAELAGVVLFQANPRATQALMRARVRLAEMLEGRGRVLDATIRHAAQAQEQAKELGLVATEFAALAERGGVRGGRGGGVARSAGRLAADYAALAAELESIMRERVTA